jgi:hypothetical protein
MERASSTSAEKTALLLWRLNRRALLMNSSARSTNPGKCFKLGTTKWREQSQRQVRCQLSGQLLSAMCGLHAPACGCERARHCKQHDLRVTRALSQPSATVAEGRGVFLQLPERVRKSVPSFHCTSLWCSLAAAGSRYRNRTARSPASGCRLPQCGRPQPLAHRSGQQAFDVALSCYGAALSLCTDSGRRRTEERRQSAAKGGVRETGPSAAHSETRGPHLTRRSCAP